MEWTLLYRSRIIISAYKNWLHPSQTVLDIGCGNGVVADELHKHFLCKVTGADILDYRKREIPFKIMTGPATLPFNNDEFDICMFNDVLHHCSDQKRLLKEAIRVARSVLIFEMEPIFVTKIADFLINQFHNAHMNMPFTMRTPDEWRAIFEELGFNAEHRKVEKPSFFYPFHHFAFKLMRKALAVLDNIA